MKRLRKILFLSILTLVCSTLLLADGVSNPVLAATDVCPVGSVHAEWNGVQYIYDYTDGSATVSGDERCVNWTVTYGYSIGAVCIKYGDLIANPNPALGTWCSPSYDISTIVLSANPTVVEITGLSVSMDSLHRAVVSWETGSELDLIGFNIYRSRSLKGKYTQRNLELIPAQTPGSVFGNPYAWTDPEILHPGPYYFKLQQFDIYGGTQMHGPVVLKYKNSTPTNPAACNKPNCIR